MAQFERDRKAAEARYIMTEATDSLEEGTAAAAAAAAGEAAEEAEAAEAAEDEKGPCGFVLSARLSGGTKPGVAVAAPSSSDAPATTGSGSGGIGMDSALPSSRDSDGSPSRGGRGSGRRKDAKHSTIPKSHLHSAVASNRIVEVLDVPCHVTDRHLVDAMAEHADVIGKGGGGGILTVFSTTVGDHHHTGVAGSCASVGTYDDWKRRDAGAGGDGEDFLDRTCFVVMESEAARVSTCIRWKQYRNVFLFA